MTYYKRGTTEVFYSSFTDGEVKDLMEKGHLKFWSKHKDEEAAREIESIHKDIRTLEENRDRVARLTRSDDL